MDRIHCFCDTEVWEGDLPPPRETLLQKVRDIEGLVCLLTDRIDADLLNKAPRLRVISNYAVGFDNIDLGRDLQGTSKRIWFPDGCTSTKIRDLLRRPRARRLLPCSSKQRILSLHDIQCRQDLEETQQRATEQERVPRLLSRRISDRSTRPRGDLRGHADGSPVLKRQRRKNMATLCPVAPTNLLGLNSHCNSLASNHTEDSSITTDG